MLIAIPVLDEAGVAGLRRLIDAAPWVDGNVTSGPQSALAKRNEQLPEDGAAAREAGGAILDALGRTAQFIAAALPAKIYPPLFNRYGEGHGFGTHIDNAVRIHPGTGFRIRCDMSATLFLSDPAEYDGGELVIEGRFGAQGVKLPAGQMILYPAGSLHHVTPVTRGVRVASFFWVQSMIRDEAARTMLFDLDSSVQDVAARLGQDDPAAIRLTGLYHNLLRRWSEA